LRKIFLIDANSLAHRAFHAIPPLTTREGLPTNAVFGFTSMLIKLLKEFRPDAVIAAFDKGKFTFRHNLADSYKAHRPETPDDLRPQFPLIKEVLSALRIPVVEVDDFEADDIIGTLASRAEAEGFCTLIVTGDLDTLQFVSPRTSVLHTKKGISEIATYDVEAVRERFGIDPEKLPDYKGLVGDSSDNIPGVPGVGPKTAAALLRKYGSLEEILAHTADLPEKLKGTLARYSKQALLSKRLAVLEQNAPLPLNVDFTWPGPDTAASNEIFHRLQFRSLLKKLYDLGYATTPAGVQVSSAPALAGARPFPDDTDQFAAHLKETETAAVYLEAKQHAACALCTGAETVFCAEGAESTAALLKAIASVPELKLTTFDVKQALHLMGPCGLEPERFYFDVMLAAYLLNPGIPNRLGDIAFEHAGVHLSEEASPAERALIIYQLTPLLDTKLRLQGLDHLFREVELPLAAVLRAMESAGVAVEPAELAAISAELGERISLLSDEICGLAGRSFNLNSPRQLGSILFDEMGLKPVKKTKTGYSTDASVLEKLTEHEIVAKILLYRQLVKFKGTYTDALMRLINPATGRLHTTLYQTVTATGRLSSADPNLQNIPIRDPLGRRIRRAFVAGLPKSVLLSADYSQIELRILAHLSGDPLLLDAFRTGEDIHVRTAAEVAGVEPAAVTPEMRSRAKVINFGIIYGMSDYGLAQELKIEPGEAHRYIQSYFDRYRSVKVFIQNTIRRARDKGYVTTILNRCRNIPELLSPNRMQRQLGERLAVNTVIQGSAADLIKKAMVDIHRELLRRKFETRMVLQVHDELLFEVPEKELGAVAPVIKAKMEGALELDVTLTVALKAGPNWHDVERIEV